MRVKLLRENAKAPTRANPTDAGADLYSPIDAIIPPESHMSIPLGFAMEIPKNYVGLIFARSSLGTKYGIRPRNCVGVIDSEYRGEMMVVLENASEKPYKVFVGDRVAQLVVVPVLLDGFEVVAELETTERGSGGFGSTGK